MCGIVGMAGNLNTKHNQMFRDMLIFDTVRGIDSTGIAFRSLAINETVEVVKSVGLPDALFYTDKKGLINAKLTLTRVGKMILGHNRAATVGKIVDDTAHPFTFGTITGVHNGTLWSYDKLVNAEKHETDSQALIETISEKGIDEAWKSFRGAAAVVYWDEANNNINLIRNSERPLYIAVSKNKDCLFWASEAWMIRIAASRHGIDLEKLVDENGKETLNLVPLKEDHLHTYHVTNIGYKEVEVRKLECAPPLVVRRDTTRTGGHPGYGVYGTEPGFTRRGHRQASTKDYTKVNTEWTDGWDKAGKESRGIEFKIVSVGSKSTNGELVEEWVTGQPVHYPNERIQIMTTSRQNFLDLCKYINKNVTFKTTARMRFRENAYTKGKDWRISSACIEIIKEEPEPENKVTVLYPRQDLPPTPPDMLLHRIGNRGRGSEYVPEAEWVKHVQLATGGTCICCGDPIFSADSDDMYWLDNKSPVCPACQEDPFIQSQYSFGRYGNVSNLMQ